MKSNIWIFLFMVAVTASGCADHYAQIQAMNRAACENGQTSDCVNNGSVDQTKYRAGQQQMNNQLNRQINGP